MGIILILAIVLVAILALIGKSDSVITEAIVGPWSELKYDQASSTCFKERENAIRKLDSDRNIISTE